MLGLYRGCESVTAATALLHECQSKSCINILDTLILFLLIGVVYESFEHLLILQFLLLHYLVLTTHCIMDFVLTFLTIQKVGALNFNLVKVVVD